MSNAALICKVRSAALLRRTSMGLLGGAAGAALLIGSAAQAQDGQTAPAAGVQTGQANSSDNIAEVVVTATKRSEQLVAVPQSITALPAAALTQFNIQSFADYGNKVPNLSFNIGSIGRANFTNSRGVTIRGMVGANTTAMYIDDTAIPITQNPRIVDVDRIEVLKGPQGTLFGAGAIGGTIRIITKQPSFAGDTLRYMAQGGWTQHGGSADFGGDMIGNVVVVPDKLAVRAMGFVNHDSGFVTREYAQSPTSTTYTRQRDTGSELSYGGSISALLKVTEDLTANAKLLAQRDDFPNGFPLVYRGLTQYDPTTYLIHRNYDVPEYGHNNWYLPAVTLSYGRGAWNLTSATSYFSRSSYDSQDTSEAMHQVMASRYNGYQFAGGVRGGGASQTKAFQQEVRGSTDFLTYFSVIGGGYYNRTINTSQSIDRVIPGFAASGRAPGVTTDVYFSQQVHTVNMEKALFGELSFKPFQMLTITGGLRKYWLDLNSRSTVQGFVLALNNPVTRPSATSETGVSPKISVRLEPDAETTVYASAAKGFRPGAPGTTLSPFCAPDLARLGVTTDDVAAGYKSDSVWTYEGGAKKQLMDRRVLVTGAAFQTDWKNIQQVVSLPTCGSSFTANAGAARVRGLELELNGNVSDALTVRVGFGYTDAIITDDNHGSTGQKAGDRLYGVPKTNATVGLVYTKPIREGLEGFVSADWSYVGSSVTVNNGTATAETRGAYDLVNLRFGVRRNDNEFSLYVNNLFNKEANYGDTVPDIAQTIVLNGRTVPYTRVSVSRPLQIGVQFRHGY